MAIVNRWYEARLLWTAKGYTIGGVAQVLQAQVAEGKRPELADIGLSESTVRRKTRTKSYAPPSFAQLVEELEPKPGHREMTEIVEAGLRLVHDQPKDSDKQPQEIANALLASFPTEEVAQVLADAVLKRAARKGSLLAKLGRRMARFLAKRLEVAGSGTLDTLQATLNHADAKIDVIDAKIDRSRQRILRLGGVAVALAGVGALAAVCSCVAIMTQRAAPAAPVACAPVPATVHEVTVNVGPAGVEEATCQRRMVPAKDHPLGVLAADLEMGEKAPQEKWIPRNPFLDQKRPPCDAGWGESAINGGCWFSSGDVKPPCGELFRYGDKCYRPISAGPQKPVGTAPSPEKER